MVTSLNLLLLYYYFSPPQIISKDDAKPSLVADPKSLLCMR